MGVNRDDVDDLLAAWALDAIDAADRDTVDAVLAVDPERARVARALQHTVAALGDVVAESPPPETRMNVLRAAAARGRESLDPTPALLLFDRQVASMTQLLIELDDDDWQMRVAPYAWTVHGLIAHLLAVERYMAGLVGLDVPAVDGRRGSPRDGRQPDRGRAQRAASVARSRRGRPRPPTRSRGPVTAGGARRPRRVSRLAGRRSRRFSSPGRSRCGPTPTTSGAPPHARCRRRRPATCGRCRMFSIATLPLLVPAELVKGPARIVLTGPGGGTFDLDGPGTERAVTLVADVVDYCRTAARRIDIDDLPAIIEGDRDQAHALLTAARVLAV